MPLVAAFTRACDDGHTVHDECGVARYAVYSAAQYTQSRLNANESEQLSDSGPQNSDQIVGVEMDRTHLNKDLAIALPIYDHKCFENHI